VLFSSFNTPPLHKKIRRGISLLGACSGYVFFSGCTTFCSLQLLNNYRDIPLKAWQTLHHTHTHTLPSFLKNHHHPSAMMHPGHKCHSSWILGFRGDSPFCDRYTTLYNIVQHKNVTTNVMSTVFLNIGIRKTLTGNKWKRYGSIWYKG
jgi:hypothetical protein